MGCMLQVARIEVGGLHCTSCSSATEKALRVLTGVSRASVSLSLQQAEVEYDPELISEVIFWATAKQGRGHNHLLAARRAYSPNCLLDPGLLFPYAKTGNEQMAGSLH